MALYPTTTYYTLCQGIIELNKYTPACSLCMPAGGSGRAGSAESTAGSSFVQQNDARFGKQSVRAAKSNSRYGLFLGVSFHGPLRVPLGKPGNKWQSRPQSECPI